ncbi:predicted protein [Verticillium alfalfae VaMs.102]|uniref:Predicted protein n=1 Tax=Verticillium alfalfae (strain VaMs.102 / ATCC MYA-4576 / FGSC 10136) TaxID=526221 RepID=C9SXC8_VERA1|nr:predicted protein [Verticillium alfalfae VaMs.102]EEY23318.1 predicted protein [Verticillium alfalfae VaMs.102]
MAPPPMITNGLPEWSLPCLPTLQVPHVAFGQDPGGQVVPYSYGQTLTHRLPCRKLDAQGRHTTDLSCGLHMWLPSGILEGDAWISLCYPDGTPNPRGMEIVHRYRPNYTAGPQPLASSPQHWDNSTAGNHYLPPPPFASGPPFYNLMSPQVVNVRVVPCQTRSRRRERHAAAPAPWYGENANGNELPSSDHQSNMDHQPGSHQSRTPPLKPRPRVRLPGQYFADDEDKTTSGDIENVSDVSECEDRSASCDLEKHSTWSTIAEYTSLPPDPESVAEDNMSQGEAPDKYSSVVYLTPNRPFVDDGTRPRPLVRSSSADFSSRLDPQSLRTRHCISAPSSCHADEEIPKVEESDETKPRLVSLIHKKPPPPIQRSPPLGSDGTSAAQTTDSTACCLYNSSSADCTSDMDEDRQPQTVRASTVPEIPLPSARSSPSAPTFSWVAQATDDEHTASLAKASITSLILNDEDFPALPAVGSVKPQKKDKPSPASRGSSESKGKKRSHVN